MDNNSPLYEAFDKAHRAMLDFIGVLEDPYKAPELIVATVPNIMLALWNLEVEWTVVLRGTK